MNKHELSKILVDYARNPQTVLQFSGDKSFDDTLRAHFFEILGVKDGSEITKKFMKRTSTKELVFEILTDVITESFLRSVEEDEFFARFVEYRNIARGDTTEFILEDNTILTVSEHSGTHWNIRRQKYEGNTTFTVKTKAYSIGVYADFYAFLTGRVDFQRLIAKTAEALRHKVYEVIAASFASGAAQLPSPFQATGTYDEATLIELYDHVQAANGTRPVIIGTKSAIAKITAGLGAEWYSNEMKNERNNTGRLGTYLGMDLIELPVVHKANTFEFAYDQNQLLILPNADDRFVKFIYEGDEEIKETQNQRENNDMNFEYLYLTRFGTATVFSSLFGIYNLQ